MENEQTEFSKRLKQVRHSLNYSQAEFAKQLEVAGSTYPKYEAGTSKPNFDAIEGFIGLGINANWLLAGKGDMMIESTSPPHSSIEISKNIDIDAQLLCLNACVNAYGSCFSDLDVKSQLNLANEFYFKTAVLLKSLDLDPNEMIKLGVDGLTCHVKNLIALKKLPNLATAPSTINSNGGELYKF